MGATITHGPHQGAQQSKTTSGYFLMKSLKSESVTFNGLLGQSSISFILSPFHSLLLSYINLGILYPTI